MSHWWRAHDDAVDNIKLGRLTDRLFRAWFNLNCLASANGGKLPAIGDVAFKLRVSEHKAAEIITALVQAGLYERREDGFEPHNWALRQFKSDATDPTNATRQKRYRERHGVTAKTVTEGVTETVTVTPPREQIAETEKKDAATPPLGNPEKELFDRGKSVLGQAAGGLIAKLLKAKNGSIALARAAIEQASEKQNPREYIGRILNGEAPREGEFVWKSGIEGVL